MKALFSSSLVSAFAILMMMQMSCAAGSMSKAAAKNPSINPDTTASLAKPEVAVMPVKQGVLVAWKPVQDADGYFVYRETQNPPSKTMLGIGPKEAQGFIDRDPPESMARYSVQAFKLSDISDKQETQALPGTTRQSESTEKSLEDAKGLRVAYPM